MGGLGRKQLGFTAIQADPVQAMVIRIATLFICCSEVNHSCSFIYLLHFQHWPVASSELTLQLPALQVVQV